MHNHYFRKTGLTEGWVKLCAAHCEQFNSNSLFQKQWPSYSAQTSLSAAVFGLSTNETQSIGVGQNQRFSEQWAQQPKQNSFHLHHTGTKLDNGKPWQRNHNLCSEWNSQVSEHWTLPNLVAGARSWIYLCDSVKVMDHRCFLLSLTELSDCGCLDFYSSQLFLREVFIQEADWSLVSSTLTWRKLMYKCTPRRHPHSIISVLAETVGCRVHIM